MTGEERDRLLDELLKECKTPEDILGKQGLIRQLTKRAVERALSAEMTEHLGYERNERALERRENTRNGNTSKTVLTDSGAIALEVPRDRDGSFEPKLVRKGQRRLAGFDEKSHCALSRGLSTREIQGHLEELYSVGPD